MATEFYSKEILDRITKAARQAVDETMAEAIPLAKAKTPVVTGTAQGSIQFRPSVLTRDPATGRERIIGQWGSFDVDYFLFLEAGARGRPGLNMLRSAASIEYPKLPDRLRRRFEEG